MTATKEKSGADTEKGTASAEHISKRASAPSPSKDTPVPADMRQAAGNFAVQRLFQAGAIQAKLAVSRPADVDEQEADRVADAVVSSSSSPVVQRKCSACAEGATCPKCEAEHQIQPKEKPGQTPQINSHAAARITSLRGGGQPLSSSVRAFFEPRFSRDFSRVRVHTDSPAAESAASINARAYTLGQDIAFGAGEYAPASVEGQRLLAHELAHVTQQSARHDDGEPIVQRQEINKEQKDAPLTVPFELEYEAFYPYEEEENRSSIYPAMFTAAPQALGYWTNPPGSAFSEYFIPAWARQRAFLEPLGQQPGGDWLLERYAGTSSYDPRSPRTSSRVKEIFGFGLRKELYPRSFLRAEQGGQFAAYTKLTPQEIASIPDILRRVNSGGKLSFTEAERNLLYRAAHAHGDYGQTRGSPFLSTTSRPGLSTAFESTPKKFLTGRPYVVRIRVPNSMVLEMNKLPKRTPTLLPEQEMLVTTDLRGRIVAVQPNPTSSLARGASYMRWGGRGLLAVGLGVSAYRIATASEEDRGIVVMQEVASHAGGLAGAGLGASGCVAFGIGTGGIVLFACGLVGATLGAEAAGNLVMMPFLYGDVLANVLPNMALQAAEGFEMVGRVPSALTESIAGGPMRAHGLMDPGNWDMRYFPPAVAPDVAALGIAMWERLGPLNPSDFLGEILKPVGSFGVPVASARRIAAFLSGPDKQYNASLPALYASLGTSLPLSPVEPGTNILEMKPLEFMELLATRKLTFIQDPNYLGGFASRLEAQPMNELRLRLLIEQRERIAEDNWKFPGKTHEQVRPLRYVGQTFWNSLKGMDEHGFAMNVNRKLSTFGITDWAFKDAARALEELSAFGRPVSDLTESERAQYAEVLELVAREIGEMTPEDYAYRLMEGAGLVHVKDPSAESYAAIKRVKDGYQPW